MGGTYIRVVQWFADEQRTAFDVYTPGQARGKWGFDSAVFDAEEGTVVINPPTGARFKVVRKLSQFSTVLERVE